MLTHARTRAKNDCTHAAPMGPNKAKRLDFAASHSAKIIKLSTDPDAVVLSAERHFRLAVDKHERMTANRHSVRLMIMNLVMASRYN